MTKLYTDDAELYDIAFGWDVSAEVEWLYERLGRPHSVLEPGCGSGRMLDAFARRGVDVAGIDTSRPMLEIARERLGEQPDLRAGDMADFDLGRTFDAAVSPINTLLHLTPEQLARHLECTARHLRTGGIYLVQVGLLESGHEKFPGSHWEATRDGTTLRCDWADDELDFENGVSRQRSRIEVLTGDCAGEVIEEIHEMTLWTPATWRSAIEVSPFTERVTYDGGVRKDECPRVSRDAVGGLLWHELVVPET
jgi:SAM-dependent methyltransferase